MNPLFSIVVPVYNRKDLVRRTLRSIECQTYRPLHVILVDNNSTDGSLQVLEQWAESVSTSDFSVSVFEERRPGAAIARNRGLAEVKSEYMLFFDSDDEMRTDAVEHYMQEFIADPDLELVMNRSMRHNANGSVSIIGPRRGNMMLNHIHHSTLCTLGFAVRTSLVRRAGGWNESLHIWDDWELGIRLLLSVRKYKCLQYVANDIYCTGDSLSGMNYSEKEPLYEAAIRAAENSLASSALPDKDRLVCMMQYRRIMLAAHFAGEGRPDLAFPLRDKALSGLGLRRRWLLRLAYAYIRRGGRGFDRIVNRLF